MQASGNEKRDKVWRILLVAGMLAGAVVGGILLGDYLHELIGQKQLARAATALGVAAVLAMVKEGLALVPGVVAYLKIGKGEGLYRLCGFVVVAAATLTVGLATLGVPLPVGGDWDDEDSPQLVARSGDTVLFLSRRGETRFVVPFFREAEVCAALGECDDGVTLDDATAGFLDKVVEGLVDCGTPTDPVRLEVRGFASSSKFEGRDDSNELNLEVANRRAVAVHERITGRLAEMAGVPEVAGSLDVALRTWRFYDKMAASAGFNDRDDEGEYSEQRGLLNRRAEILLHDPAGCEVVG